jgi:aryl-alcohol dehydrogenase-like predicted oxidoreductase
MDLLQLHSPPANIVEAGEWIRALDTLKQEGKIRYYGVSCDTVDAAYAALRHSGVSSLQVPMNLLSREFSPVLDAARQSGVAVIARECLANGLLVKAVNTDDVRKYCQSDAEAVSKAARLDALRRAADGHGLSLMQLALKYVTTLPGVSVALVGVSGLQQLTDLLNGLPRADETSVDFSSDQIPD